MSAREHRWKVRTGVRRRFRDDGIGGGRFETVIEGTWAQCTACGMSEGMVALLNAPCPGSNDPPPEQSA